MKLAQFDIRDIEEELQEFTVKQLLCNQRVGIPYKDRCVDGSLCNITECIKKGEFVSTQMRITNKNW